jgi:hypothetical protein
MTTNVLQFAASGEIKFLSARTVAKFKNKKFIFILSLNRDFSTGIMAETFTTAYS